MATFYPRATEYSGMYGPIAPSSLPLQPDLQKTESLSSGESEGSNLLTSSLLLANGMETAVTTADLAAMPLDTTWSSAPMASVHTQAQYSMVITPPPEATSVFPPAYSYPAATWQDYGLPPNQPIASTMAPTSMHSTANDCYLNGSTLVDSPISSPSSTDSNLSIHDGPDDLSYGQPAMTTSAKSPSPLCYNVYTHAQVSNGYEPTMSSFPSPSMVAGLESKNGIDFGLSSKFVKEPRMPQRKGGIQLWQFLYSLLTNPEKKYSDIIEWTAKAHEKEFRMLEPESIAIWWGHHKNKPSMTYDKFSRSLRYYYDKGILKKIPGERYVYRFLIDPELMYHHIGTSDCRPKVKPMPQAAKAAMTKFHKGQNIAEDAPIITQEPETLEKSIEAKGSSIQTSLQGSRGSGSSEGWPRKSNSLEVQPISGLHSSASTGNLLAKRSACFDSDSAVPIKRCRSLESASPSSQFSHIDTSPFPSSCPQFPQCSQFSDTFSPDLTVSSTIRTIITPANKPGAITTSTPFFPSLCDSVHNY